MVTRPAPDRSAPIADRCAAPVRPLRTGHDQDAAEVAFVRVGHARRHDLAHALARQELEVLSFELFEHRIRDADVRDHQISAVRIGRGKDQRNLRRAEGDRHRGFDRRAFDHVRVRRHARRQIDRNDRDSERVHVGHHRLEQAAQLPAKPGAEDRVDDEIALGDLGEVQLPFLRAGDLDDSEADPAEDFEIDPGVAA